MPLSKEQPWERFKSYDVEFPSLGIAIEISPMKLTGDFCQSLTTYYITNILIYNNLRINTFFLTFIENFEDRNGPSVIMERWFQDLLAPLIKPS